MKLISLICYLLLAIHLFTAGALAAKVKVIGLFTDKALLQVDGQQKLLSKGETFEGVTLQSASGRGAQCYVRKPPTRLEQIAIQQSSRG